MLPIGAFILICFLAWLAFRMSQKAKSKNAATSFMTEPPRSTKFGRFASRVRGRIFATLPAKVRSRVPWLRNSAQTTLEDGGAERSFSSERPYSAGGKSIKHVPLPVSMPAGYGYYGPEKSYQAGGPGQARSKAAAAAAAALDALKRSDTLQTTQTTQSSQTVVSHAAAPSFSSTVAQYSVASDVNGTIRSRMPDAYYNQSQMARQPSDAYDPSKRNVNRISELSSLSSGFGDGDIIVQAPSPLPQSRQQADMAAAAAVAGSMGMTMGPAGAVAAPPLAMHPLQSQPVDVYDDNRLSWTSQAQTMSMAGVPGT